MGGSHSPRPDRRRDKEINGRPRREIAYLGGQQGTMVRSESEGQKSRSDEQTAQRSGNYCAEDGFPQEAAGYRGGSRQTKLSNEKSLGGNARRSASAEDRDLAAGIGASQ
jgi:hypothetical protein